MIYISSKRLLIPLVVTFLLYIYFLNWLRLPPSKTEKLKDLIKCNNKNFHFEVDQSGSYWILKNFIKAEHGPLECYESITYTTTSDIRCIENIVILAERFVHFTVSFILKTSLFFSDGKLQSVLHFILRTNFTMTPWTRYFT